MPLGFGFGMDFSTGTSGGGVADPYAAYAANGFTPAVIADFTTETYRDAASNTAFADMFTFARASTATYVDSSGVLQTASSGTARLASHLWNGSAWVNEGILLESEARTNLLLNSGTLSTQNVTTTAQAYTLSFTGTGTVTLSGTSTAGPLVGTGTGENNRVNLTFTPTAGTLTLTVSGTVTNAQLEAGSTPSSYIPTVGSTVTRAAETLTIAAAKMAYDATNMSFAMDGKFSWVDSDDGAGGDGTFIRWLASGANQIKIYNQTVFSPPRITLQQQANGVSEFPSVASPNPTSGNNTAFAVASRNGASFVQGAFNGGLSSEDTTPSEMPAVSTADFEIGQTFMGYIAQFRQWPDDIGDTGIVEASS